MIKAKIVVTLKKGVSDPQGLTVQNALKTMKYEGIQDVRIGKYIEVALNAQSEDQAKKEIQEICEKLLVNPIIEQYQYALEPSERGK
jgi:phosphoribosylformylglycinamidine synthase PurS subunit